VSKTGVTSNAVEIEEALAFVDYLRLRDWKIGIDQDLAVRRVFKESASARAATPHRVKVWLASTLAHDPREQNAIFVLFDDWLAERRKVRQRRVASLPVTPDEPPERDRRGLAIGATSVIVVVVLLLAWVFFQVFTSGQATNEPARTTFEQPINESGGTSTIVVLLAVIGSTAGLAFAALLLFRHGRRMQLRAMYGDSAALEQHLLNVSGQAAGDAMVRALWRELRVLRPTEAADLDIERTIDATLRGGGCFAPAYKVRKRSPEYVMLIDRVSAGDHLSAISEALVDCLKEGEVPLTAYTFHSDPRVCWNPNRPEEVFSLREIAALHHDDRLVLLTDGAGLIDPYRGTPYRWVDWFSAWTERAIITPVPRHDRGARERMLAAAGFAFVTAADQDVTALASAFDPAARRAADDERDVPGIPRMIARDPRRWLDRETPDDDDVHTMRRQLRVTLGAAGYRWLCACAVYPALDPRLTRHVGSVLGITSQPLLLAISRLPWFRAGRMPEWARLLFISDLAREDEMAVRDALGKLIDTSLDALASGFALPITTRVPWVERVLRRMRIHDASAAMPLGSDFRDHVFLDFMDGRKPSALQFEVKEFVAAVLKRRTVDAAPPPPPPKPEPVKAPVEVPVYQVFTGAARVFLILLSYLAFIPLLPLIPRLVGRKRDPEIVWHASNGLAMWLTMTVMSVGSLILSEIPSQNIGFTYLSCLLWLGYLTLSIIGTIHALRGRRLRIWLVSRLADKFAGAEATAGIAPAPIAIARLPQSELGAAAALIIAAALVEWVHAKVLIGAYADAFNSSLPTHRVFAIVSLCLSIPAAAIADRLNGHARSALAGIVMTFVGSVILLGPIVFTQYLAITLIAIGCALARPSLVAYLGDRFNVDASGPRYYARFAIALIVANWLGMGLADVFGTGPIVPIAAALAFVFFWVFTDVRLFEPYQHRLPVGGVTIATSRQSVMALAIAFVSFAFAIGISRVTASVALGDNATKLEHSVNFGYVSIAIAILAVLAAAAFRRGEDQERGLPKGSTAVLYAAAVIALLLAAGLVALFTSTLYDRSFIGVVWGPTLLAQFLGQGAILLTLARVTQRTNRAAIMAMWVALLDLSLLVPLQMWEPVVAILTVCLGTLIVFGAPTVVAIALYRKLTRRINTVRAVPS
jgi:hypothetical protein